MNNIDKEYFRLLNTILEKGKVKKNRTGIDTIGVFGEQAKFDISLDAFPILTTKKVWFKGILHELLWFIKGDTNIKYLVDNDVHIWDEWAYSKYKKETTLPLSDVNSQYGCLPQSEFVQLIKSHNDGTGENSFAKKWGELGEGTYGGMWREFPVHIPEYSGFAKANLKWTGVDFKFGVDQLNKVVEKLKSNPDDRRMIVSAWHPYLVDHCALPPCHVMFHFNTEKLTKDEQFSLLDKKLREMNLFVPDSWWEDKTLEAYNIPKRKLNCLMYIRSNDFFLGAPFNITSYSLLTAMVAHCVGMTTGTLTYTIGDLHLYVNHIEQAKLQLSREPMKLPSLWVNPDKRDLFDLKYEDIKLVNYNSHPSIKGDVAI